MRCTLKKLIYIALIACYSFGATVGNVIVLRELLNSGDKQHQNVTSEKKSRAIPDSPVSIRKAHIAPTVDTGHFYHLVSSNDILFVPEPKTILVNVEIALIYSSLEFLPSKPRDPPLT